MRTCILQLLTAAFILIAQITIAAKPDCNAVAGKWAGTATRPNGPTVATAFELSSDGKFKGAAEVNGTPFWNYAGTWECKDTELTWSYKESSRPLPDAAKVDVDELISVDAAQLVLKSRLSGSERTFKRTR